MKFDLLTVLKHFAVEDGRLVRKLATGHARPVTMVERGRLVSMVGGVKFFGPDVAYACLYRVVPMFPIVQVDGNPFNMAENNLMPCRVKRLRFRRVPVPGGFRHPLCSSTFRTEGEVHRDWVRLARGRYMQDKAYVRQLEDQTQGFTPEPPKRAVVPRKVYAASKTARERPEAVEGRIWHWWVDGWLSLPVAVHESDDWMVRAAVVAVSPEARFVYDDVLQKTVAVV